MFHLTRLIAIPLMCGIRPATVDDNNRRSFAEVGVAFSGGEDKTFPTTVRAIHGSPFIR